MPSLKHSFLSQLHTEIADLVTFELWDTVTKNKLDALMQRHNVQYEAASFLDNYGKLNITIFENDRQYKIQI